MVITAVTIPLITSADAIILKFLVNLQLVSYSLPMLVKNSVTADISIPF